MEEKILLLLSSTPEITTTEIARKLKASRTTIIRYLEKMRAKDVVNYRRAGPSKLWYIVHSEKGNRAKRISLIHNQERSVSEELERLLPLAESIGFNYYTREEIEKLKEAKEILNKKSKKVRKIL